MDRKGFTLVELMISTALLVVVGLLSVMAFQSSRNATQVAQAKSVVQSNVRNLLMAMSPQLELASALGDTTLTPPVQPCQITANPAPNSPIEVSFQVPLDNTGQNWSNPIRFRFINEDQNGNAYLDTGEDADTDGLLSRRILRIEDRNGDGDTNDAGEQVLLAGANDLSNVQFALNNDVLTITLTAAKRIDPTQTPVVTARAATRVFLQN